ncbi:DUF547 domain-containing protein [uncultured Croceitalea sp.]|uniref:DUF547 domain-containing protein n=1 Tax=uncultured Croceitalea sp. TaxID=1798908 RepID=UPI0033061F8F
MKQKTILLLILATFFVHATKAQDTAMFFAKADHFFKTYVKQGKVDYSAIKEQPKALDELMALANAIAVKKADARSYQAFWINTYNLAVIKGIVANYPIKSPLDKTGFFDKIKYDVGGQSITLNDIENKLLRGNFPKESRFHFVLVCAGLGCPPIIANAYLPDTLDAQLQKQTELSLNNPNFIQTKGKKVLISQLFDWYKSDFTQDGLNEVEYINQFRTEKLDPKSKIGYYNYNWSLNETK